MSATRQSRTHASASSDNEASDRHDVTVGIIDLVLAALPPGAMDRADLSSIIDGLKIGPAASRALMAYLETEPDALTSGRSDGPPSRLRLLEQLAERLPGLVEPGRCLSCQRQVPLYRKMGADRCCTTCWAKANTATCVRCGEDRSVAEREPGGGAVCQRCRRQDTSKWEPCIGCGRSRPVAARTPRGPQCQRCIPKRLYTCARCGREGQPAHAILEEGPICDACYHRRRTAICSACGTVSPGVKLRRDVEARLCDRCWSPPVLTCTTCGEDKPIKRGATRGRPICESCRSKNRPLRTCVVCGNERRIHSRLLMGAVCGPCYTRMRNHPVSCATCEEVRPLVGRDDADQPICGPCAGEKIDWICHSCGEFAALYADGRCASCTARLRVRNLCSTLDGEVHPQLQPVVDAIDTDHRARGVIQWLDGTQWADVIGSLARSGAPITHEALDDLQATRAVTNARGLLVQTGVLEPRDESVERTAKWIDARLEDEPDAITMIVRPYATWSVLRRARKRRANSPGAGKNARARINAAIQFLTWLDERGQTLRTATQRDVDEWLVGGKTTRYLVRAFVLWAHDQGLCADLDVPWRIRDDPINYLTDDQRQHLLASVLRDAQHSLQIRTAAALLLTFGLTPTAIVTLRVDDVTQRDGRVYLHVGRRPLVMPGALGALIDQLAAEAPDHRHTILAATPEPNQWLFPGTVPGRAADPGRLAAALNKRLGLSTRHARNTAISALALDIPAPVLAGLLGIQIGTAIRWTKLVKRDWGDYLVQRAKQVDAASTVRGDAPTAR